jgi:ABC-type polar amino acid transport system ATPase subunit
MPVPSEQSPPAIVDVRNISKWYGALRVLNDVSLRVTPGQKLVICGPSGSGKSTFIRCLNRLESHQEGEIFIDGVELHRKMTGIENVRRNVGMVFQNFNLFPHMTVMENITAAPIRVLRENPKIARDRAEELLQRVKIPEQADKYPSQLSGGQQQRVAIARALCMQPKIMLFDEPTSALDPEMVNEVLDTMVDLARSGMTMICVTHEMGFARSVADEILFMDKGEIIERSDPESFFSRPRNPRTKQFLGQILSH